MPPRRLEVEPLPWAEFKQWFAREWKPGQHLSVIAPTGAGKTTFVGGLLELRKYVLALDPKGGDSTLSGLGYPRLAEWPGDRRVAQIVAKNDDDNKPSRFIVGPRVAKNEDYAALRETTKEALDGAFNLGGFTVYADELQILSDPRMMNLRKEADRMLIAARDKGLSFVSSYQAPAWVTPHAGRMSTWVAVSYTRDQDTVDKLAGILGRPRPELRGAISGLDPYTWLIVGRDPRAPLRVTLPDFIEPKRGN